MGTLLDKSLQAGWRVVVRAKTDQQVAHFDQALWKGPADSFRPHGAAGSDHDTDQPILLTTGQEAVNTPDCLMVVGGADVDPTETDQYERVWVLLDGNDADALAHARTQWKQIKDAQVKAQYWSEDAGRWEMKAET